ncbi:MAG TPA: hypothetical protein VFA92_13510 [Candidatus Binatia bacterium]|jgi:hypothetical protein|nr:hypothetical protein [Candidatus Binatia bacterium]
MGATSTVRFGYTAERGPFRVLLAAIAVVLVIEVPVLFFLLGLVLPPPAAVAVLAVLTLAGVVALLLAASPLFTTHRLQGGVLRVRYGLLAAADVPVAAISGSRVPPDMAQSWLRLLPGRRGERVRITFSGLGLLALELDEPVSVRLGPWRGEARELLLNVDERDVLLETLSRAGAARVRRRSSDSPHPPER